MENMENKNQQEEEKNLEVPVNTTVHIDEREKAIMAAVDRQQQVITDDSETHIDTDSETHTDTDEEETSIRHDR